MDNNIEYLKVEDIIPSKFKFREDDRDLDGLTISIQNYGIIQPLLVRPNDGKYEIVLGQRRYEAALSIGLKQIPAVIKKLNDKEATEYIILDNIQRKNFTKEETNIIYNNLKNKYNIDKYYISSNLGLKDNNKEEIPNSQEQSNILKDEQFKSIIESDFHNSDIKLKGNNIVNLDELNKKEIERDDFIMNNEILNNTNLNNMEGGSNQTTQVQNTTPTFGGRFFPSLEDEQTNMGLNTGIPSPTSPSINEAPKQPVIDLTNLNAPLQEPTLNNPQLEPTASILNPIDTNIPTANPIPTPLDSVPSLDSLNATPDISNSSNEELSIKVDSLEQPNLNVVQESVQPMMPNLDEIKEEQTTPVAQPSEIVPENNNINVGIEAQVAPVIPSIVTGPSETVPIENNNIVNPTISSPEIPTLSTPAAEIPAVATPAVATPAIETPTLENPVVETPAVEMPTLEKPTAETPTVEVPTVEIPSIEPPALENPVAEVPNLSSEPAPAVSAVEMPTAVSEKKDVIPAVNTIKSIVDTLSQLGYQLNVSETNTDNNYNITIEIQK